MLRFTCLLSAMVLVASLHAQDAYHQNLMTQLQNDYGLPAGTWVLPNTETATLAAVINYGGTTQALTPTAQSFTLAQRRTVSQGNNPWDAGHIYQNTTAIAQGNKCLLLIWLRSTTPDARVNFYAEHSTTYAKELLTQLSPTPEWKLYAAPFESTDFYAAGELNMGLHLAYASQIVEIGGAACINYANTVDFSDLPILLDNDHYEGIEPDAPWRAEAAASIDALRKANLGVQVRDADGNPLPGAQVHVAMQQHAFKFGTAVVSNRFNGGSNQNNTYEQKLINLDGQGHGFNEVVFENDLKWPAWEDHWFSSWAEIADDISWLADQGISMRGHNLLWPGWGYSPGDINNSQTPAYIRNRIRNHLNHILSYPGVGTACADWDVINELTYNNDYANHFAGSPGYTTGRELYREVFRQADSLAPASVLYLNDYVALEQGDLPNNGINLWKTRIDELLNAGVPVEGIGFQGHFSAAPTGIPRLKEILDDFWNTYGLEAKITEYDIDKLAPPNVQGQYMRDVLSISFAHPSMKGFLMWGFWDGAHWLGNAPIFREDWSLKPGGEAFIDQVFHQWWTDSIGQSDADGNFALRGFKGRYTVTVACPDGSTYSETLQLDSDTNITVNTLCTTSSSETIADAFRLRIAPNPAETFADVYWNTPDPDTPVQLQVLDVLGQVALENTAGGGHTRLDIARLPAGVYTLVLHCGRERAVRRMVRR